MPVIDIDLPEGLVSAAEQDSLVQGLGQALLRAEGLPTVGPILAHAAVYIHIMAAGEARTMAGSGFPPPVRVRLTTAAGSLDRAAQRQAVAEMTRLISQAAHDPSVSERTLVLHSEIAEGGWGDNGAALGREDFDRLNAALHSATADQSSSSAHG